MRVGIATRPDTTGDAAGATIGSVTIGDATVPRGAAGLRWSRGNGWAPAATTVSRTLLVRVIVPRIDGSAARIGERRGFAEMVTVSLLRASEQDLGDSTYGVVFSKTTKLRDELSSFELSHVEVDIVNGHLGHLHVGCE